MKPVIQFTKTTFAYWSPDAPLEPSMRTLDHLNIIWDELNLDIPAGVTSILGENGIGKSTLLLLAGARLVPQQGSVFLGGTNTKRLAGAGKDPAIEEERSRLATFLFQNMEIDSEESLAALLESIADTGSWSERKADLGRNPADTLLDDLPKALDLTALMGRRLQELAKGELQRALIAMAVCYGSPIIIMDEPTFAMEERHKKMCFEYLSPFCANTGTSLIYTAHDIELCRDYAQYMLLINKDKSMKIGPVREICTRENLETAYQAPMDTLYQKQRLYRDMLVKGRASAEIAKAGE